MKNILLVLSLIIGTGLMAQQPVLSLTQLQTGFDSPVDIKHCGDDRLFIVEQDGKIRIMSKTGVINTTPFLDITGPVQSAGNEQGLLGLAFSPNYKQDGFFYINYIFGTSAGSTRISRFSVSAIDSNVADLSSEVVLLTFTQPYSNHNGGNMMFGPDGYLYISTGDGGSANDPQGNGQNKNTFLGKTLRIDVTNQTTYVVPASNPFVGQANVKPEIWAYGLRNPWRASFDRLTGDMWIGDVGQDAWEEIDFQDAASTGGENYGWRCREGFNPTPAPANTSGCPTTGFVDPVYQVAQAGGTSCSITGGYVYRGAQYGKLFGRYLFTDYCSGRFWGIRRTGPSSFAFDTLQTFTTFQYVSFGEDNLGELYVCWRGNTSTNGRIYKISETSDCNPVAFITFKDTLSECTAVSLSALKGDGLSYQWYNSQGMLSGATENQFNATESGYYKVMVSKTGQAGCEALSDSVYVLIKDTTTLTIANTVLEFCKNEEAYNLIQYAAPTGGTFSGTGIVGSTITPLNLTAGTYEVNYALTNTDGCSSSIDFGFKIFDTTIVATTSPSAPVCNTAGSVDLTGYAQPSNGVFSGTGVSGSAFDPSQGVVGANEITYTFTNNDGCVTSGKFSITVENCTGIGQELNSLSFRLYPNPNQGRFTVSFDLPTELLLEVSLMDMSGRRVLSETKEFNRGENKYQVQSENLLPGVFYLQVLGESINGVSKVIVE